MRSRPKISASVTIGLIQTMKDAGIDQKSFREFGFDPAVFSRTEGFIPCCSFARVLQRAAELTGDCAFGLRFGANSNPKNLGALAYAVLNSATLSRLSRRQHVISTSIMKRRK